ncbi:MAG TPA: class I SAM-dependent methyltransferase [Gemmatimonadaceae bacterium]|nr:class I SAM-dependent methyltransferase [Gemmatimonadaceae bacterium]
MTKATDGTGGETIGASRDGREARSFYAAGGLNVETYDARTEGFPGEIDFYVARALASGGPVLELACGSGRVSWPIARAGVSIVGLDLSAAMLGNAERKRASESPETSGRARFVEGNVVEFHLGETFALAIVPFRAFQMLLTTDEQRCALACMRRHLRDDGRLILDVFDPKLEYLVSDGVPPRPELPPVRHPASGNLVTISVLHRTNDPVTQRFRERWRFTELGARGEVMRDEVEMLELRWSYRYEMRYLLELAGFVVEEELSDFLGAPPSYGKEQIWVARRR